MHGELCSIAKRRTTLDADEARCLREAEELEGWRALGYCSLVEYLECELGYGPGAARERLRVARALADLPGLADALADDTLRYSALRELTRVATPETEQAWLDAVSGCNLRQVEDLVSGHRAGDLPDDPVDPELHTHKERFDDVTNATAALLRQARAILDEEYGGRLDDDQFLAALSRQVVGRDENDHGRALHQIAVTVCDQCKRGWQDGAGVKLEIDAAAIEQAHCDAQHIGSIDDAIPTRATQDVPPAIRRLVFRRDHGRCVVPAGPHGTWTFTT